MGFQLLLKQPEIRLKGGSANRKCFENFNKKFVRETYGKHSQIFIKNIKKEKRNSVEIRGKRAKENIKEPLIEGKVAK